MLNSFECVMIYGTVAVLNAVAVFIVADMCMSNITAHNNAMDNHDCY